MKIISKNLSLPVILQINRGSLQAVLSGHSCYSCLRVCKEDIQALPTVCCLSEYMKTTPTALPLAITIGTSLTVSH